MASYLVKFELPTGCSFNIKVDGNTKLSPHFKLYEVANTKGKITLPQMVINEETIRFLRCLEKYREYYYNKYGEGITVNSGFRQAQFNKNCGGSANSLHLQFFALDQKICKLAKTEEHRKADENEWKIITMSDGLFGGCNWYTNGTHLSIHEELLGNDNFVHRDYRGIKGKDW